MNKKLKGCLILTLLLLLTIGVVNATEVSNDTTTTVDTTPQVEQVSKEITSIQKDNPISENDYNKGSDTQQKTTKTITKNTQNTTTKTEQQTIILNSNNFDEYITDGTFNEKVNDGDTIDIQGKLDSPRFSLNVQKAVNIISSTNDAYIYLHTSSQGSYGEYKNGIFQVTKQGAGTNITGITFYNTRVSIENTSNIKINNISLINEHASIGMGVGAMTIREGSENITVSNSYFKTRNNGGHSNVVFAAAYNCLFENNTIEGYRSENPTSIEGIGNLLYLTTYNIKYATPATNINITIRNNTIRSTNVPSSMAICYGLCLEGSGHIIENNYIDTNYPVMAQYADASYGTETNIDEIIFNNNTIVRGNPQLIFPGTVTNNTFGEKATLNKVKAYNNIFKNVTITNSTVFENNYAQNLLIEGNNNTISNNEVYSDEDYAVKVTGENNTLENNKFAGYLGRGEITIQNSTEITSINNSEDINRVYVFNDENWEKYLTLTSKKYNTTGNFLKSNDTVILNITDDGVHHTFYDYYLSKTDSLNVISNNLPIEMKAQLVIINSTITIEDAQTTSESHNITLINSTLSRLKYMPISINSSVLSRTNFITNTDHYVLTQSMIQSNSQKNILITDEGFLNIPAYSN